MKSASRFAKVRMSAAAGFFFAQRGWERADRRGRRDAGVVEQVDTGDLKSPSPKGECGFDPRPRHSE